MDRYVQDCLIFAFFANVSCASRVRSFSTTEAAHIDAQETGQSSSQVRNIAKLGDCHRDTWLHACSNAKRLPSINLSLLLLALPSATAGWSALALGYSNVVRNVKSLILSSSGRSLDHGAKQSRWRSAYMNVPDKLVHCPVCDQAFPSNTKLYAHLRENAATCGLTSGANLTAGLHRKLRKSVLSVGYGVVGGHDAAKLLQASLEAVDGGPIKQMTRASHDSQQLHGSMFQQGLPALGDVFVFSSKARSDIDESVAKEDWLRDVNSNLSVHGVKVFDRQFLRAKCARMDAQRHCKVRVYQCLVPMEFFITGDQGSAAEVDLLLLQRRLKPFLRSIKGSSSSSVRRFACGPTTIPVSGSNGTRWLLPLIIEIEGDLSASIAQRMVGTAICMFHGWLPQSHVDVALSPQREFDTLCMSRGLLLLQECRFGVKHTQQQSLLCPMDRAVESQVAMDQFYRDLVDTISTSNAASAVAVHDWLISMEQEICPAIMQKGLKIEAIGSAREQVVVDSASASNSPPIVVVLEKCALEVIALDSGKGNMMELLNSDDHKAFITKNHRDISEIRPDITHQCLMALLDSPLNKAGKLLIYLHTAQNILISVHPSFRIPRTFKRFSVVFVELLRRGVIKAAGTDEVLMQVVPTPISKHLPSGSRRVGLSINGRAVKMRRFCASLEAEGVIDARHGAAVPVVFTIGAVAHGDPVTEQNFGAEYIEERISIYPKGLTAAYCCSKLCNEFETFWDIC